MRKQFATSLQRRSSCRHKGFGVSCNYVSNCNISMGILGRHYAAPRKTLEYYVIKHFAPAFSIRALSSATVQENKKHEPINIKQVLSPSKTVEYHVQINQKTNREQLVHNVPPSSLLARMVSSYFDLVSYFLPKGYPNSTGPGYSQFAIGQATSVVLSTAGGVLSMQALLCAIGVGTSDSLPMAATLNWVIKDGLGQLGGVIFASVVSNRFDADAKRWRMTASISMDLASFIELLTPLFPGYFLPLASVANVGKNISFLAASASRAAIHKTFAVHENLADITAKTGSQCILGAMLGTGLGIATSTLIGENYLHTVMAFGGFTALSLTATYFSLLNVQLASLSLGRLDIVLHEVLTKAGRLNLNRLVSNQPTKGTGFTQEHGIGSESKKGLGQGFEPGPGPGPGKWDHRGVPGPAEICRAEIFLGSPYLGLPSVVVGANVNEVFPNVHDFQQLSLMFQDEQYIFNMHHRRHHTPSSHQNNRKVVFGSSSSSSLPTAYLLLKDKATKQDLLRGLIFAFVVRQLWSDLSKINTNHQFTTTNINASDSMSTNSHDTWELFHRARSLLSQPCINTHLLYDGHTVSLGERLINDVMESEWHVEELLLETRHARLVMPKTI